MLTAGKYEGKLGGKKEFIRLAEYANNNGVTFLPDVNTVRLCKTETGLQKQRLPPPPWTGRGSAIFV